MIIQLLDIFYIIPLNVNSGNVIICYQETIESIHGTIDCHIHKSLMDGYLQSGDPKDVKRDAKPSRRMDRGYKKGCENLKWTLDATISSNDW